ncbi:MAG: hypothetical protein S4CHLAM6_09940 [Chlamydiae bacterium]|nr:hypothetical protein [Chlamydiota bacterium]
MEPEIVSKGDFKVIGITKRISNDNAQQEIPEMWKQFILNNYLEKIPSLKSNSIMALYTDYEGDHTKPFNYTIGCEVNSLDDVPADMNGVTVPGNKYALYQVKGGLPDSLIETWKEIWTSETIERKFESDFEVVKGADEVHVYISLK